MDLIIGIGSAVLDLVVTILTSWKQLIILIVLLAIAIKLGPLVSDSKFLVYTVGFGLALIGTKLIYMTFPDEKKKEENSDAEAEKC